MAHGTKSMTLVAADVEFEPCCEWRKYDGNDTLVVHLPGFKKDQLRVQVNNLGGLKVSGARPVDGGHMSRFVKETKIPQGCHINDIRAKFINGCLHVTMPSKAPPTSSSPPQVPKLEDAQNPKAESLVANDDQKLKSPSDENGKMGTIKSCDQENDNVYGIGSSLLGRVQEGKKVSVSFGMAMLAMVAIGVYVAYKCGTDPSCPSPSSHIEDYFEN